MKHSNNTDFWLDRSTKFDVLTGEKLVMGKDYHKIASTLRSISNFVNIVTGDSIPVTYNQKDESYTDGSMVVISSNIKDNMYDATVGLALHEGSHCKLTDFKVLHKLIYGEDVIPSHILSMVEEKYFMGEVEGYVRTSKATGYIIGKIKDLLNIVEDRRIDSFIFNSAPGYRGYYQAMYDKYFNSNGIDKGLRSSEKRDEDWDSYMFRIVNITNSNRDLKALNGLLDVWKEFDLRNIDRLENTEQSLRLAFNLFEIIESNIIVIEEKKEEGESQDDPIEGESQDDPIEGEDGSTGGGDPIESNAPEGDGKTDEGSSDTAVEGEDKGAVSNSDLPDLNQKEIDRLKKDINKQKEFLDGNVKKTSISKTDKMKVEAIAESQSDMVEVGGSIRQSSGVQCIVVNNITAKLIESGVYSTLSGRRKYRYTTQEVIDNGMMLGNQLGRKLQVRNDENSLKYNRLRRGNIDKRMIASLGFGNEQVFQQIFTDKFKPVDLHISVDASGSMSGSKWKQTQISVIAIAKAASMVSNLNVVISYRSTETIGRRETPAIFIAYDSKKDKIGKIRRLFGYISCPGITPEGLCFEAIQKQIVGGSSSNESYFLNFSDGQPYFVNNNISYYGMAAYKHTKAQMQSMKDRGIKILSYFISDSGYENKRDMEAFKYMYGSEAESIKVENLNALSKSLNKLFTEKN